MLYQNYIDYQKSSLTNKKEREYLKVKVVAKLRKGIPLEVKECDFLIEEIGGF